MGGLNPRAISMSFIARLSPGMWWRPEPESNRRARICSPLRNHSAIGPRVAAFRRGSRPGQAPTPALSSFDQRRLARASPRRYDYRLKSTVLLAYNSYDPRDFSCDRFRFRRRAPGDDRQPASPAGCDRPASYRRNGPRSARGFRPRRGRRRSLIRTARCRSASGRALATAGGARRGCSKRSFRRTGERALVIGAGTGYSAALLAAMGLKVTALECGRRAERGSAPRSTSSRDRSKRPCQGRTL